MKVGHSRRTHKKPFKWILIAVLDQETLPNCFLFITSRPWIHGRQQTYFHNVIKSLVRSKSTNNHLIAFPVTAWVAVVTLKAGKVLPINSNYCSKVKGWAVSCRNAVQECEVPRMSDAPKSNCTLQKKAALLKNNK